MKINPDSAQWDTSRVKRIPLEGEPRTVITGPAHRGRTMKADTIRFEYRPDGDAWAVHTIELFGIVIKANDQPGKLAAQSTYYSQPAHGGASLADAPEWARRGAEFYRPREAAPTCTSDPFEFDVQSPGSRADGTARLDLSL
ncbi:hypothetical protein [Streptomyces sp. NRRL S-350]|uniref:hypothetical protein n=1 Tax=Streptomyces sp. NRRL S-350 TaxID=1463902 RepID=UPI0004BEC626|nr:hypothetical protein [Streptomyces sp. NRRL S-350]